MLKLSAFVECQRKLSQIEMSEEDETKKENETEQMCWTSV